MFLWIFRKILGAIGGPCSLCIDESCYHPSGVTQVLQQLPSLKIPESESKTGSESNDYDK